MSWSILFIIFVRCLIARCEEEYTVVSEWMTEWICGSDGSRNRNTKI
jgi:hypothetical protein